MTMHTTTTTVDASSIIPRHEITDESKLARLVEAMGANGWQGRPVLVVSIRGRYEGITGSHRVVAAQQTGTQVPVLVLDYNDDTADAIDIARSEDDYDCESTLRRIAADAADLMQAEIDNNATR